MEKTLYENLYEYLKEKYVWWEQDILDKDIEEFADHFAQLLDDDDDKGTKNFKIYKYQPIGQYAFHNIMSKQIHLSENGKLNDLFEGVLFKNYSALNYSEKTVFDELAYMTCFAISPDNILMWSHYADSFRGICIEYDLDLLGSKNEYLKHLFLPNQNVEKNKLLLLGSYLQLCRFYLPKLLAYWWSLDPLLRCIFP